MGAVACALKYFKRPNAADGLGPCLRLKVALTGTHTLLRPAIHTGDAGARLGGCERRRRLNAQSSQGRCRGMPGRVLQRGNSH